MKEQIYMFAQARLFKSLSASALAAVLIFTSPASVSADMRKTETGLYRDVFDQNMYYEGLNYFHLDRFYRALFNKKQRALNVNAFDEVPDSAFFTNRHARNRMSSEELKNGNQESSGGPDFSNGVTVYKGKFEGLTPGFFVVDSKGQQYLLKFDPADNLELTTSAEVATSRFFHAIGYNVPEYNIVTFDGSQMKVSPDAYTYDDTGFQKKLTMDRLQEYLMFLPQDENGRFRASASKVIAGEKLGYMSYMGRRKDDPQDTIDHKDRRELRALPVFASWLNVYDIRESNTYDALQENEGQKVVKHYILDFGDSLGAAATGPKPPMFTHEHMMDYGEMFKSFITLGFRKKAWQKRWEAAGRALNPSPAIGYFDNQYFDPARYKVQLPHYAFKDMTKADAFWAAKIIMAFSDEDIRTMVQAGQYSNPEDADYIAKTLIERRDIIGKYWFTTANSLDDFEISGSTLTFKDLASEKGFDVSPEAVYDTKIFQSGSKKAKLISTELVKGTSVSLGNSSSADVMIRKGMEGEDFGPFVLVRIRDGKIAGIFHQD